MKRPNFFIVGAPRCGTTALSEYLRSHPNVFFCQPKEPHFFATDFNKPFVSTEAEYLALFSSATDRHWRIGEGSTRYLYSKVALANIREFAPDAKIIVMLRNPVDMVYSFHSVLLRDLEEDIEDFETAWEMQERRKAGHGIPATCHTPEVLQYREVARFGQQIEKLFGIFDKEQVKVIIFDDFIRNPRKIYEETLSFLEIPQDGRLEFPRVNESRRYRFRWLAEFTTYPPAPARKLAGIVKRVLGSENIGHNVMQLLRSLNYKTHKRSPLKDGFRQRLKREFETDLVLLESLIDRDLSDWRK